jgi:uncharacterized protein YgiM (DUF1202 family)
LYPTDPIPNSIQLPGTTDNSSTLSLPILYKVKIIFKAGINVRSGPGAQFELIGELNLGDERNIFAENAEKTHGMYAQDHWITLDPVFVAISPAVSDKPSETSIAGVNPVQNPYSVQVIWKKGINIRSGPGIESPRIGGLKEKDQKTILAENNTKTFGMFSQGQWITLDPTYVEKV